MNGNYPNLKGVNYEAFKAIADDATPTVPGQNIIPEGTKVVDVVGVQNDANDWIELPSLARVQNGHEILILCNAGANFEIRTPASSNEKINDLDSDGTKEYLATDTHIIRAKKRSAAGGWTLTEEDKLGAVVTAVVPD